MKKLIILIVFSLLFSQEIGFVGDSTTDNYYPGYTGGWFTNAKIIKYAVPGAGIIRAPYLYKDTQEYQDALNRRPEFTIMLLGSDDFWVYSGREIEWRTEYNYLVNTLRMNSNLILGTILYRLYEPASDAPIQAMNSVIRDIANNSGLIVADFNSALGKNANYYIGNGYTDGIHPNDLGQRKMAEYAKNAILQHNPNTDTTPPAIPSNFSAVAGDNQVTLSWAANTEPDIDKYFLFRDTSYVGLGTGIKTFNKNYTSYVDTTVHNNTTYYYFLAAGDTADNRSRKTDPVIVTPTTLAIDNYLQCKVFSLKQNMPNPFNPKTKIEYTIPFDTKVNIVIYDLMGNKIKTLINDYKEVGQYTVNWDGTNQTEQYVSGGIYFYKLQAGDFTKTRKMILLK